MNASVLRLQTRPLLTLMSPALGPCAPSSRGCPDNTSDTVNEVEQFHSPEQVRPSPCKHATQDQRGPLKSISSQPRCVRLCVKSVT
ncbi:hypothetical protein MHYP_G00244180 [Metynnis hypsauchen]